MGLPACQAQLGADRSQTDADARPAAYTEASDESTTVCFGASSGDEASTETPAGCLMVR
jgi:hypothetical protein